MLNKIPRSFVNIDDFSILAINDGSKDDSLKILEKHGIKIISNDQNIGLGNIFKQAIDYALKNQADILVTMDSDNQFDPNEIEKLIQPIIKNKTEVSLGNRFFNKKPVNMPLIKYYGNKLMSHMIGFIANKKFQDVSCGFRAYSKEVLLNLNLFGQFTYTQETILDLAFKNKKLLEIPISVQYFKNRKSFISGNLWKYSVKTLKIIINSLVSFRPLFLFGGIGLTLFIFGLFFDIFIGYYYLTYGMFSPYKAYAAIGGSLNLLGVILITIGLILQSLKHIRLNQEEILYYQKKYLNGDNKK
ncbi:glycosyltransferase family 2 protein [Candidatus Woesearchaeota archaeon]|nr:glycosyltransferase family 2 protein [Candidatus Woesearchaeota archaeon]